MYEVIIEPTSCVGAAQATVILVRSVSAGTLVGAAGVLGILAATIVTGVESPLDPTIF